MVRLVWILRSSDVDPVKLFPIAAVTTQDLAGPYTRKIYQCGSLPESEKIADSDCNSYDRGDLLCLRRQDLMFSPGHFHDFLLMTGCGHKIKGPGRG